MEVIICIFCLFVMICIFQPAGESSAIRCFAKIRPPLPSEAAKLDIKVAGATKLTTPVGGVESTFTFDGIYDADVKTVSIDESQASFI